MEEGTNKKYVIHPAEEEELASLPAIERAAASMFLATDYPEVAIAAPMSVERLSECLERGQIFVAVDLTNRPVGFAVVYELDGDAYLEEMDVCPEHGRQGIADS